MQNVSRGEPRALVTALALAALVSALAPAARAHGQTLTKFPLFDVHRSFAITAGRDGALWFTEPQNGAIGRITTSGEVREFPVDRPNLGQIAVGPDGQIWFQYFAGLGRITADGNTFLFALPEGGAASAMVTGLDGNLWYVDNRAYFLDNGLGELQRFISRRAPTGETVSFAVLPTVTSGGVWPHGVTVGPDGNIWFTRDNPPGVGRVSPDGAMTTFPTPDPQSVPVYLVAGPDGNVWFGEYARKVGRMTLAGDFREFALSRSASGAVTRGADGNIWFGERDGIARIDTAGVVTEYPLDLGGADIWSMTTGSDGNIWFAYSDFSAANGIGRFEPPTVAQPALFLREARFEVQVAWSAEGYGDGNAATATRMTGDTGAFYFFSPNNLELVVKIVDGTAFNGRHWVFVGGLTDVGYTLKVRDLLTHATRTYSQPAGHMASYADTDAFGP